MMTLRPWRQSFLATLLFPFACLPVQALPGALDATSWSAKVDPPAEPMPKPASTNFAIPFPGNFGGGGEALYPTTTSPFVVIGKNAFDKDVRQVWNLATRTQAGSFRGQLGLDDRSLALSPDGAYLAGKATFRKVIEVRAAKNGRAVQSFDIDSPFLDFIDFAGPDRLIFGRLADRKLAVHDIKSGDKVFDLMLEKGAEREALAFSPGRHTLAVASRDDGELRVYDLSNGKEIGQAPTPRIKTHVAPSVGLSYSDDGAELAGLFEMFGEAHLVCWDAATGKELADFDLGKDVVRPLGMAPRGLTWMPDKSAWLVQGSALVDRQSGKALWNLPFDNQNLKASPRRFLDNDHAMVVTSNPAMALRTYEIPRDKIAGAAQIVRSGGNAADASLPPLKPVDLASARRVTLSGRAGTWSVTVGSPAEPLRLTSRPITLKGKSDDFRTLLVPGSGSSQVVVVGTPKQLGRPDPYDGQSRWVERIDLAGGRALGRLDLPSVSDPIAVAPDAGSILVREAKTRDRLDLYATADAKPILGWRPYAKEAENSRAVTWAGFVDPNRVLTLNSEGTLVLWSVPDSKPTYVLSDAFGAPPVLDPSRTLLLGFDGKTLRVLDAATGALKGEGSVPATSLGLRPELKASAIDPDGQRFAALFQGGTLVGWDLKTGKISSEFRTEVGVATQMEWAGDRHILLDGRTLLDLDARRVVWSYLNAPVSAPGPDGRHWYLTRGAPGKDESTLAALDPLAGSIQKAEALLADPKSPAVIRPGFKVSIQLAMPGPAGDAGAFLKSVTDSLAARLKANGLVVTEDGPPNPQPKGFQVSYQPAEAHRNALAPDVRLVVSTREKPTGEKIQYRRIGGRPFDIQQINLVDLVCEMSLVDAKGTVTWMPPQTVPMQPFGFVLRMPAGENDPEVYLKKLQWARVKDWISQAGPPYFVARDGNGVVRLPGQTDLSNPSAP